MKAGFVTGASRGIGLEIVRQLLQSGERVVAACRNPNASTELAALRAAHGARLDVIPLDVADEASIHGATAAVRRLVPTLDLLFNVAGTKGNLTPDPHRSLSRVLGEIEARSMATVYATNAIGPLLLIQDLRPLLHDAKVINVSSSMGSNGLMNRGDWYAYRASKAALNIISHALSFDLRDQATTVVAMHPGWVRTAMGTDEAPYDVVEATTSLLDVVERLSPADSGTFLNWKGEQLPW